MSSRLTPSESRAALEYHAGNAWVIEAERIAALPTRLERTEAIAALWNDRVRDRGAIQGRAERIWARAIVALPDKEDRRAALEEIPLDLVYIVRNLVRDLWAEQKQGAAG